MTTTAVLDECGNIELDICTDCLVWYANGDLPEDEDRAREVREAIGVDKGYIVAPGSCEDGCHFSWSSCDTCRSPLGGDRHQAFMFTV